MYYYEVHGNFELLHQSHTPYTTIDEAFAAAKKEFTQPVAIDWSYDLDLFDLSPEERIQKAYAYESAPKPIATYTMSGAEVNDGLVERYYGRMVRIGNVDVKTAMIAGVFEVNYVVVEPGLETLYRVLIHKHGHKIIRVLPGHIFFEES